MTATPRDILALSGGVGGAKLALGLADVLAPGELHVLVNTGDDFTHLGLQICPDIDTLLYTLAGRANQAQGWGLEGESWATMDALEQLGGETWFRLGDRDMATHLWRSQQLRAGAQLSAVTSALALRMGIASHVHPMTDDPVHTIVHTGRGDLPFQHYFVRDRCEPAVSGFSFDGIALAQPNVELMRRLHDGAFRAVLICPSNPFVSIDPILQLPGLAAALRAGSAPVVVVSPIVAGLALKGPAAKMMAELGMGASALEVARHYCEQYPGLMDCFVIDESDATLAAEIGELGVAVAVTSTVMKSRADKQDLARFCLQACGSRQQ
ncbi:MAG: 2-phospho-L-lactate transferase [Pseudomonadales bacterium]|nr:2-phospho-L-lactate transferase [Halioglobus sp.]MCP5129526.1 2-phospho-L-lactate transferase [Pseudomonadales bacterium]